MSEPIEEPDEIGIPENPIMPEEPPVGDKFDEIPPWAKALAKAFGNISGKIDPVVWAHAKDKWVQIAILVSITVSGAIFWLVMGGILKPVLPELVKVLDKWLSDG